MWNKSVLLSLIISGLIAQNNSFNFQTNGPNEDFVTIQHDDGDPQIRPTSGMTLEAWVKPTEDPAAYDMNGIISYLTLQGATTESGFAFIFKEGKWRFVVITDGANDVFPTISEWPGIEIPFDGNTWTHIAGTYNGTTAKIFKNGVEEESYSGDDIGGSILWEDIDTDLFFGKYLDGNNSFKGSIDEVRLWDIARLEDEIQVSMNSTVDVNESRLVGYWTFNDNQSATIVDHAEGTPPPGTFPGVLTNNGNGTWDTDVFAESGSDCFNMEITPLDFPFSHLSDLTTEDDDWDMSVFNYPNGEPASVSSANGNDYTYKLTLAEANTIYITTCDIQTNVDVQIAIYTSDCSDPTFNESWILYQDDSQSTPIYYPDETEETFTFECQSGFESSPTWANMLPLIPLEAGTYYVVVDDRNGGNGTVKIWMGYSLLVDSTEVAGDFSEVGYFFSEGVYGGNYLDVYNGNGIGLETTDFGIAVDANGGDANQVNLTSLEALNGASLSGGEEVVVLNLEYPITPSGGEILTVGPFSESSIFNNVGVPLLNVDGIEIELIDALAPSIESTNPQNGESGVSSITNITVIFTEAVLNSVDGENITNSNVLDCFILEEAVSGDDIDFTITSGDQTQFEINPDPDGGQLPENAAIKLSMLTTIQDLNGNNFAFDTIRFVIADETPPQINASSISSVNEYVSITFSEGVYSSSGFSNAPDLTYMGEFGNHKYYGSNYQLTWTEASDYLDGFTGAHLATITSQAENDFISGEWASGWIGFNDVEEEGNWVWVTGENVTYTNWASGEPNNSGEEHYAEIFLDGTWNDLPNDMHTFIAEVEEGGSTGGLELTDFSYTFTSNGGNCESVTVIGLTNTAGEPLVGGETTIHAILSLSGAPSGVETITVSPIDNSSIYDYAGNTMNPSDVSDEVTLLASALLISTELADSNVYVDLGFSTGIYGNAYQSIPVYLSAFESIFEPNDGTATSISLTSLTDLENNALVGGEDSIRIHMSFNELPSGIEAVYFSPVSSASIYSISGVPIPDGEIYGPITLNDEHPPIGVDDIDEGEINVSERDTIKISFNENIYIPETANQVTVSDLAPFITLAYDDATGESIPFLIDLLNDPPVISIYPALEYNSEGTVYYAFNAQLQDLNENPNNYSLTATFTIRDYQPPVFQATTISPINSYVTIEFDEPIYANSDGTGGLTLENLDYFYDDNGGNCENLTVTNLSKENGTPLTGGETAIRAVIELSGSASGVETLYFSPSGDPIYDAFGNIMNIALQTGPVTLLQSAYIENQSLADSNEYIDLYYSVGVYGNSIQTQPLYLSAFTVNLNTNEGTATAVTPISLTDTDNNSLTGGEDSIRLFMSFDNFPSGVETINISPTTPYSIYSYTGIPVPISEISDTIFLNDQMPPMGDDSIIDGATDVNQSDSLTLTFTEDLYIPNTGDIATESYLASFVTLKEDDSNGADIPFTLSMADSPPVLTINPVEDYQSESTIFYSFNGVLADVNGNSVEINFSASFTIQDYMAPVIDSSALALDNSYLDLIFDEQIYGTDQESGPIGNNTIEIEIFDNGSLTDTVIITSLTRTDSNFLIGGETSVRLNLSYNSTPSGNETMVATVRSGVEIFDDAGNQMTEQTLTDTIQLYDILPPSISSISVPIDSFIVLMQDHPIKFSFNESIDSIEFNVTGVVADEVNFVADTTIKDSSIEITLIPPFTSFDSITVYFSYIEDYAGLTTVDISYTYVTPLLGDYDLDSAITYKDLWDLITNWSLPEPNLEYQLAPVTGEAPHFISTLDNKFDIEDGMAFVRMWSWYQKTIGTIRQDTASLGRPLELIQKSDNLLIIFDQSISGGQISFSYDIGTNPVQFNERQNKEGEYYLTSHNSDKGFSTLEFARSGKLKADTVSIQVNSEQEDIAIYYQLINNKKLIVQKGSVNVNRTNLPTQIALYPAYPNPFNPTTTLRFDLPESDRQYLMSLNIYDLQGRLVETLIKGSMLAGRYSEKWHANQYASGMYFARLTYGEKTKTQKILLLK